MTVITAYIGMTTSQGKIGISIMIKTEFFPAPGSMALLTIGAIAALVHIIQLVAGVAGRRRLYILFIHMATGTSHFAVTASQAKLCFIVIKLDRAPAIFIMATLTLPEKLTHFTGRMRTVIGMTAITCMRRFTIFFPGLMAFPACDLAVLTAQGKIGEIMIECQLVQLDNIRVPTLMIRMATFTGLAADCWHTPVITRVIVDVITNFLVAIQA